MESGNVGKIFYGIAVVGAACLKIRLSSPKKISLASTWTETPVFRPGTSYLTMFHISNLAGFKGFSSQNGAPDINIL